MKLFGIIRAPEWWGYKLPPLLSVGYATALTSGTTLYHVAPLFLFFLGSLAIGAVYVSIINDITDIEEDIAVGKTNRMANLSPLWRGALITGCLAIGGIFGYFMWPDIQTIIFYTFAWMSFSLYSLPPFRFKERGLLGVLCDACGAHLFPSLLMVSGISYTVGMEIDYYWLTLVAIWALMFGCRGILWHQFLDRENDIKTNISTFATRIAPERFKPAAPAFFAVELAAFGAMLKHVNLIAVWISLVLYAVLVIIRYSRYANIPIILITPRHKHTQVLMIDYYQTFFPLSLLLAASFSQPHVWGLLIAHVVLFPSNIIVPARDYWMAIAALYRQLRYS
ncbi:UbiA family prenyltransferase [Parapedobacter deserti]|uniref:UbiA family prenyltransferase n=1 Tax=Parapedobacter deserti TaxID=1912957 RepID=A0ABV7JHJ0_9SPHI